MSNPINAAGEALIKSFEGKGGQPVLSAYLPTPNDVPTIGWGHTSGVQMGDTCTEDEAEAFFQSDITWAEDAVDDHVTVSLTENQRAALVSICFNIGQGNFDSSTLLRDLNGGDYSDAASQFLVWDKQRGVDLPGLDRRREAEQALFNTPDDTD